MTPNYSIVTELPGAGASEEQVARLFSRYHFACQFCVGKEVLEAACGAGIGLGYLARVANKVIGGDIDYNILQFAIHYYRSRDGIRISMLDAQKLPFEDNSIDVVILYEAIYYLPHPETFVDEACRILRENGVLIICTVNKDWSDFNPSRYNTKYFSAPELYQLLRRRFTSVDLYGAFSTSPNSGRDKIISLIKRTAVAMRLIPRTMKGKELFKRIFLGKLIPVPSEVYEGMCKYLPPVPILHSCANHEYKVLYAVASTG